VGVHELLPREQSSPSRPGCSAGTPPIATRSAR
jgi:hypothetical protein